MILLPYESLARSIEVLDDVLLILQQHLVMSMLDNGTWENYGYTASQGASHLAYLSSACRHSVLAAPCDVGPYWQAHHKRGRIGQAVQPPAPALDPGYRHQSQLWMVRYRPERYSKEFDLAWP